MLLDPEQQTVMALAGTIYLPSPPPARGTIEIHATVIHHGMIDELLLRITHRVTLKLLIHRFVHLNDVRAIAAPSGSFPSTNSSQPTKSRCVVDGDLEIELGGAIRDRVHKLVREAQGEGRLVIPWLSDAVLFVPEAASVLMQVETGMTAAESAAYYPPLCDGPGQVWDPGGHIGVACKDIPSRPWKATAAPNSSCLNNELSI